MRYKKRKKAASQTLSVTIIVVCALAVLLVLACSKVFSVRDIMVVGNRSLLQEEVITQSGVKTGDNVLGITGDMLRARLEQNRYIEYLGHGFDYRGTLTLRINERLGMAVVNVLGLYYVLDDSGMVLECAGSAYPLTVSGPYVVGLALSSNAQVTIGEILPVRDTAQLEVMKKVLDELNRTGMLVSASELSVKNLDNLFYTTREGTKVELGDDRNLNTKLLIAREVLAIREPMGDLIGAKIDVSAGTNAHYIPAELPTPTPVPTHREVISIWIGKARVSAATALSPALTMPAVSGIWET